MTRSEDSLLGRAEEWKKIVDALERVRRGSSSVVLVHGEAGIGKTRLVREVLTHAENSGFAVLAGRAEDLERMRPFGAIADAMANLARKRGPQGTGVDDLVKDLSSPSHPVEAIDRFVEFVEELALSQPTCVVLEDLHWADADTIAAARALTRRLAYLPILFVGTHRPHPQSPDLQRFVDVGLGEGGVVIELRRLDEQSVVAIAAGIVGGAVGPRLANMLKATSGNPLFAVELARALQEEGVLRSEDGRTDAAITELPPTLRLTILRRLSQFPADVLEVLKAAAILGSTFHLHELAAIVEQPVAAVARTLEGPIAAKILEERDGRLAFRHDLIHEAIYEDIPAPIRASQHVDVAHRLRSLRVPPVRIAEHLIRGLDTADPALFDEAMTLITELRFLVPLVAQALADKALTLPGISEHLRDELRRFVLWPMVMTGRRADVQRLCEEMLRRPQDPAVEGMARLILAVTFAEEGRSREAFAALGELVKDPRPPAPIRRLIKISELAVIMRAGVYERVEEVEQLLAESRDAGDGLALTVSTGLFAGGRLSQGYVAESIPLTEEYLQMEEPSRSLVPTPHLLPALVYLAADKLDDARGASQEGSRRASETGELPALSVYGATESLICFLAGAWDEALAEATFALELIDQGTGSSITLVLGYVSLAQIAFRRGSPDEARLHLVAAERMISEKGPQLGMDLLAWTRALLFEASGDLASALDAFLAGWDATASARYFLGRPVFADLVRMAIAGGDRDRATEVTEDAEEGRRRAAEIPSVVGTALRCRGLLEDDADLLVAAVEAYRDSPRVVDKAAACEDAAGSLAREGKTSDARPLYEDALAIFEELGAVHDAARVSAAMRSAGIRRGSRAPRRRPATGWEALTATEIEVARLTIEGLSNPKIGERLFVSQRTVQTHLSHIFGKLGISSRVDLARMAGERTGPATRA